MKKKVLITGGSGTIGRAFIKEYYDEYEFYNYSRGEKSQTELVRDFPKVTNYNGCVTNHNMLLSVVEKIKPDIIIHAAAVKHVNIAEENPIQCTMVNVIGSMNVIEASKKFDVPITIGISTDKACVPVNVYGKTKSIMEKCFMDANTDNNRFAVCRFANVTHSNGSVLPFWLKLSEEGKPLRLTDPNMNRLMFSQKDASELIRESITMVENSNETFVLVSRMKSVNMFDLANVISTNGVEIIGARAGEKQNEDLIGFSELDYSYVISEKYIVLKNEVNNGSKYPKLTEEYSSKTSKFMTTEELKKLVYES